MNNELVFQGENNQALTNSLLVAEKFEKNHSDVVRAIDNLLEKADSSDFQCDAKLNIHDIFYSYMEDVPQPNGGIKPAKRYVMNRDGFTLLTMGFTGKKAMKFKLDYIAAFNAMEKKLNELQSPLPRTYSEALRQLADEVEAKEKAKFLLERKTEQLDESKEWFSIKRWAKEHGINWRNINWRALKAISVEHGYEVKKIFDGNYGEVNIYHKNVFDIYLKGVKSWTN